MSDRQSAIAGPNEAVNFQTRSVFVAIPKTGTTTIRQQLMPPGRQLAPMPHLDIIQIREVTKTFALLGGMGHNRSFPTGDLPTTQDILAHADKMFGTLFKFSSVRNPWARAASLYARKEGVQIAGELSFEAFCERHVFASDTSRWPTKHQNQLDWLVDETGNIAVNYVFKIEELEQKIPEIRELTQGRVTLKPLRLNTNTASQSAAYRDLYTSHSRSLIARHFEKDIDFFKYAF